MYGYHVKDVYKRRLCLYKHGALSTCEWQKVYFLPREKPSTNIWVHSCLHHICFRGNSASNLSIQTTLKRDLSVWCDASMIFLKSFFMLMLTYFGKHFLNGTKAHLGFLRLTLQRPYDISKFDHAFDQCLYYDEIHIIQDHDNADVSSFYLVTRYIYIYI